MSEDMALDEYRDTCYFDVEDEEFYDDSLSKDLFKKFELQPLPPTPPQSPPHNPFPPDSKTNFDLQKVSQILDNEYNPDSSVSLPDENTFLIQDCMWSGPCLAAAGLLPNIIKTSSKQTKCHSKSKPLSQRNSGSYPEIQSGECVSPSAVFPAEIRVKLEPVQYELGSVAETPSPSESEDEEEIDVVTVVTEKLARQQKAGQRAPTSLHSHLAAIHNYSSCLSPTSYSAPQSPQHTSHRDSHHSYAGHKRSRPISMPASPQPIKKQRSLLHATDLNRVAKQLKLSKASFRAQASRSSSDSEGDDTNKRAQHNVLERKRRNDLKYSFMRLRDNVPDLMRQERTPKVTILKLSSDYVRSLNTRNRKLESEHLRWKAKHEYLKHRLAALRRDCL